MAKKKRKRDIDTSFLIGVGLLFIGIAAIAFNEFLKTNDGKALDTMSIDALKYEMEKEIASENYERAAWIRDLIKQKTN